jgi:hypothetical protein
MRPLPSLMAIVTLTTVVACRSRVHDVSDAFRWQQELPAGSVLHLRTSTGKIEVAPTSGSTARVSGSKRWAGRKDPIHFAWTRNGNDVYLCAMTGSGGSCSASYRPGRGEGHSFLDIFSLFKRRPTQVEASLTVELPPDVMVEARAMNGDVSIHGARAGVAVHTLNGSIEIDGAAGPIEAHNVNGGIDVRVDSLGPNDAVALETVNGGVSVSLPPSALGEVELATVNGSVQTDFPLTATGQVSSRRIRGRIGNSSREIRLKTVNGEIELRKNSTQDGEPSATGSGGSRP